MKMHVIFTFDIVQLEPFVHTIWYCACRQDWDCKTSTQTLA